MRKPKKPFKNDTQQSELEFEYDNKQNNKYD